MCSLAQKSKQFGYLELALFSMNTLHSSSDGT